MKKVETKNKMKGLFGLFATLALAIGVGVSLAQKEVVRTQAADTLVNSFNFLDGGTSGNNNYANTDLATKVSYASDNPGGTSGTTDWEADWANLSGSAWTRLGGKAASSVQTDNTTAWANIKTTFTFAAAISKVEILGAATFGTVGNVGNSYLQYSTNGTTWTTEKTITTALTSTAVTQLFDNLSIPANSYLRYGIALTASETNSGVAFTGIKVYTGEEGPEPIAVIGVALNKPSTTIMTDESETLIATVSPGDASNKTVTWESSDEDVATITNGVVTGISVGTTTITVKTVDGNFTADCIVTVIQNPLNIDKFSAKGFGGYTGGFDLEDHTGTVGTANTTLAMRVYNGGTGAVRGNQTGIAANFSMRNIDRYPGYIRKIVLNGTGGTSFTASVDRSLVNVGNSPYTLDNATTGTKVQGVVTSGGGVYTLTWTIPANIDARYFILHNLLAGGTMLAAADDAIQIFYEPVEDTFGTLDHITVDSSSSALKKIFYVGEALVTTGLLVTAYDTEDNELVTNEYTSTPAVGYKFQQSDLGSKSINLTVTITGVSKSATYNVEVIASSTYNKVEDMEDVRYRHVYTMASPLGGAASVIHNTSSTPYANVVTIDYNEETDSFTDVTNLLKITLEFGVAKGSYAIKLLNGENADKYFAWNNGNTIKLNTEINEESSWYLNFGGDDGFRMINVGNEERFIAHNHTATRFASYANNVPSGGSAAFLYIDHSADDAEVEALVLADAVNSGIGNLANKTCHAAYDVLSDIYSRLSVDGKAEFDTSSLPAIEAARERMAYLAAWTAANSGKPDGDVSSTNNKTNSLTATIIIGVVGLTTLAGYYFLRKKKEA